jgi:hypothetical protein
VSAEGSTTEDHLPVRLNEAVKRELMITVRKETSTGGPRECHDTEGRTLGVCIHPTETDYLMRVAVDTQLMPTAAAQLLREAAALLERHADELPSTPDFCGWFAFGAAGETSLVQHEELGHRPTELDRRKQQPPHNHLLPDTPELEEGMTFVAHDEFGNKAPVTVDTQLVDVITGDNEASSRCFIASTKQRRLLVCRDMPFGWTCECLGGSDAFAERIEGDCEIDPTLLVALHNLSLLRVDRAALEAHFDGDRGLVTT